MPFNPRVFFRKTHRWGAILVAVPFLLVLVSGLLLQVKKQVPWVQPPTKKGEGKVPTVTMAEILAAVTRDAPQAGVQSWDDIDRLDLRPKDGVVKVQCKSCYEVQVDFRTGAVLQVEYRRSDLIETLHDGSWFGDAAKLYVFLPVALVVLGLWVTGVYLFVLPYAVKWRRRRSHPPRRPGPT
ncbi:MAG TPA: PepSY domain-containing protein [Gemmata sp.]|nr:PepSY domain-containing protein [Gemmata sp.]